jgi:hypothetical protein
LEQEADYLQVLMDLHRPYQFQQMLIILSFQVAPVAVAAETPAAVVNAPAVAVAPVVI